MNDYFTETELYRRIISSAQSHSGVSRTSGIPSKRGSSMKNRKALIVNLPLPIFSCLSNFEPNIPKKF